MKKSLLTLSFLAVLTMSSPVFAGANGPDLRTDTPPSQRLEPHLARHKELNPYIAKYGWVSATSEGACTIDGAMATPNPHHCRDYRAKDGTAWRVVFNDPKGGGGTQRIYQMADHSLTLRVQFENNVVIADNTGTVRPYATDEPAAAVAQQAQDPKQALKELGKTLGGLFKK